MERREFLCLGRSAAVAAAAALLVGGGTEPEPLSGVNPAVDDGDLGGYWVPAEYTERIFEAMRDQSLGPPGRLLATRYVQFLRRGTGV